MSETLRSQIPSIFSDCEVNIQTFARSSNVTIKNEIELYKV